MAKAHRRGPRGAGRRYGGASRPAGGPPFAASVATRQEELLWAWGEGLEAGAHEAGLELAGALLDYADAVRPDARICVGHTEAGHTEAEHAAVEAERARLEAEIAQHEAALATIEEVLVTVRALHAAAREAGFVEADGAVGSPRSAAYLRALHEAGAEVETAVAIDRGVSVWTTALVERYLAVDAFAVLLNDLVAAGRAG